MFWTSPWVEHSWAVLKTRMRTYRTTVPGR